MFIVKILKIVIKIIKAPKLLLGILKYLINDLKSFVWIYHYPAHIVFVIGSPRSGTTWVQNMLLEIPGYNPRSHKSILPIDQQTRFETTFNDFSENYFNNVPNYGYSVCRGHLSSSETNLKLLNDHVDKIVLIFRDIRDVCVSLYYNNKTLSENYYYEYYQSLSDIEAFDFTIYLVITHIVPWVENWHEYSKNNSEKLYVIKYEELWEDTSKELRGIISFLGVQIQESFINKALCLKIKKAQDLKTNSEKGGGFRKVNTARKGGVGGWKYYFTEKQKNRIKKSAGKLLIELGYEKDFNW